MKKYLAAIAIIFLGFQSMAQNSESDSTRRALLKTLQQTKEDTNRVNAIIKYGDWWSKTNLDSALTCYLKAEKLGQKLKYVRGELKGLAAQSTIFVQKGKYNDAIEVTQRAMAIAEKKGSLRQKAIAAGNVGHAYVQSGKTMEAIPLLMKANTQLEQLHDSTSVCIFSANIAHVYADLKQYNICLSYVKKAYAFCKPNDTRQVATCLNNITQIYALLKNYKEAERYGTLALTKARESGALTPLCNALINMGTQVYLNTGRIPEAIALNDEALSIAKKLNYPDFQLGALEGLALGHFKLENYAKADFYLNEAISLVDSTEIVHEELGEIYQVKSQLDFIRKDYRSAYEALAKYSTINDTLTNLKTQGRIRELEAQYEAVRKEKQIELLQRKQQTRNTIIYSLLAGLLVLGVVGFLQYRNINIGKRIAEKEIIQLRQEKQLVATNSILKGQDEERSRVAKDLHDGLGGLLSGIKLTLNNMRGNTILPEGGIQTFNRALEQLDSAIGEMRRIAHNMMPESLVRFGLVETLKDYCEDINQSGTMRASFQTYGLDKRLESSTETILYRILQEAINNVIKHAKATEMQVQLTRSGNQLSICIEDNGIGFDINSPQYRRGSGARNIQQRVDYLNGKLDIRSVPGKGTSVFIEIPA